MNVTLFSILLFAPQVNGANKIPNLPKSTNKRVLTSGGKKINKAKKKLKQSKGKFTDPQNIQSLKDFAIQATKSIAKFKYGNIWVDVVDHAVNGLIGAGSKNAIAHSNYTKNSPEKYYTRTTSVIGSNYSARLNKYKEGPAFEVAKKLIFDSRRDARDVDQRKNMKSKCGCQQKIFTFLDVSTFLDYKKVSALCHLDSHELMINSANDKQLNLMKFISENVNINTVYNESSKETKFSLNITDGFVSDKLKSIQETKRVEHFSALLQSNQKITIFNWLSDYNTTIKIHLVKIEDDSLTVKKLLENLLPESKISGPTKAPELVFDRIRKQDLVSIESPTDEDFQFSQKLVTHINAKVLELKSFRNNAKIIRTWRKELPSGGQWDFYFREIFKKGINLNNLVELKDKLKKRRMEEKYINDLPLSYTFIIEAHGDFRCNVVRKEDGETFSGISSPVYLSFEHELSIKHLVRSEEQDISMYYRETNKDDQFEDESIGMEIYPNRKDLFQIDFNNININNFNGKKINQPKSVDDEKWILNPTGLEDKRQTSMLSDLIKTLKTVDPENADYIDEEDQNFMEGGINDLDEMLEEEEEIEINDDDDD